MKYTPEQIYSEYKKGSEFKASLGDKGLYEQSRINERFYIGDQWYGAKCGNDRPLVRHNLIKRIGDYKMSTLLSGPIDIYYSAEGVPNTLSVSRRNKQLKRLASQGITGFEDKLQNDEISFVMSALNSYQKVTGERVGFGLLAERALKNAFISGTGIVYTYWDSAVKTGLYADEDRTTAITGDIASECINLENICFGDPYNEEVQSQPFIIIASVKERAEVVREAEQYNGNAKDILPDSPYEDNGKVTVYTRLWKEYDQKGEAYVMAQKVTKTAVVRDKWNVGIRMYPIAKFCWESRKGLCYGDSEITYLIPNQIAINRMITSGVWSAMSTGMPTMVVNGDVVDGEITNDPGQIIKVYGSNDDVKGAISYITPPDNSANFTGVIEPLINNTLSQSGANAAALGDVNPNNTSAIIQLRNAAKLPLTLMQNRYFAFLEEISRIWAEFWITGYGKRKIKIEDENGVWYADFDGERYKDLIICAKAELSTYNSWNDQSSIEILNNLLERGAITIKQYLKRLPKGLIGNISELIDETEGENDGN